MKISITKAYKSIKAGNVFSLSDFTVLTGKNGSGKTHLLEAIHDSRYSVVTDDDGKILRNVMYIKYNDLNPKVVESCSPEDIIAQKKQLWTQIKGYISSVEAHWDSDVDRYISAYRKEKPEDMKIFDYWYSLCGRNIDNLTEDFISKHFSINTTDLLSSQLAAIMKLYHNRLEENDYNQYRNEKYGNSFPVYSNEEFESLYGPKPWILINGMLEKAGLPYCVNSPEGLSRDVTFSLKLYDDSLKTEIHFQDLSTGEKVLMGLALAIYNSNDKFIKPDLLLIDEPDAPLHPEFSKILLDSVCDSIVKKAGVKVIITTHSPSTVAITDDLSLYIMKKGCYPQRITKMKSILDLTKNVDNLKITTESRRQIFVESKYDVVYYQKIYKNIDCAFKVTPVFLAPNNTDGCNCEDVKKMTEVMRSAGNDLVYGFVDSDGHYQGNNYVFPLGFGNRYAIDNYIFDPIFTALLLLREGIITGPEFGLGGCKFTSFGNLSDDEIQRAINYISDQLGFTIGNDVEYKIQDGRIFKVKEAYFKKQGHSIEDMVVDKWPKLKSITAKGKGDSVLKNYVLDKVISEYPQFISYDFVEIMNRVS